jgi:hypothetical protein
MLRSSALAEQVMLPVLFLSNKIDWKNEDNLLALQAAFASISIVLIITLQFTLLKIAQKAEKGRVQKPGYKFKQTVAPVRNARPWLN